MPQSPLSRFLWSLVALGLALYAALTLWLAFTGIFFPYQLDYGEGIVLWFTRQLALGQPIYFPLGEPYAASNYPPVFMLLAAPLYPLFGDSYIWGRWLNFASILIISALILRVVREETQPIAFPTSKRRSWSHQSLLAALLFFGSTFIYHWSPLFRVDMPGVAFTLVGIVFVWKWEHARHAPAASRTEWLLALAIPFFLLALYTKHSLFVAPIAAVIAIFFQNKRAALFFALTLGLIGGTIFLALDFLTRGAFRFDLIALNATVWTPHVFIPLIQNFILTYAVMLALAAWSWWTRVHVRQIGVLEIYAVAALLSLALAGREGAWQNYFLEAVVMVSIFTGLALARLLSQPRWQWALPLLLLVQLVLFWNDHDPRIALDLFSQTRSANEHVAPLVHAATGTIISEDMGLLVTNGKPVAYYTFPYSTLARAGRWDQHWETENLQSGNFPLVILWRGTREDVDHFGNFTRAFVSALDYGYAPSSEDALFQIYTPAPLAHQIPNANFGSIFELVGWTLTPDESTLHPNSDLTLTIVWRAQKIPPTRYTTFVHLEDASGSVIAQDDHEPHDGTYPTTHWAQDEMVRDTYRLHIPTNLKSRDYFLRVGWYDTTTQDRLTLPDGTDTIELKKFLVQ
ncbi:MAG TPA: hypothetical protein VFD70_16915 [Anaerolineae bacterium]|nr:hypothetical protein [Anaerolineae bacterium]